MARSRKRNKKWISWLILLILLVAAGIVCYFVYDNYFREKETEQAPVEPTIVEPEIIIKPSEQVEPLSEQPSVEKEKVVQYDGGNPNEAKDISGVITYAGVSGDNLMIRLNIDQFLEGGECMLLLETAGNTVYSNVARIVDSASTSTCEGFNVPKRLLESGRYNITVEVESGNRKGTIKGEVNI